MTEAPNVGKVAALLVDLDGTLVDVRGIRHFVEGGKRDFETFHLESVNCPPNRSVLDAVNRYHEEGLAILVVTARTEKFRRLTEFWLADNKVQSDELLMRGLADGRPDIEVKTSMFNRLKTRYDIRVAIDDRNDLVDNWIALGIEKVIKVGGENGSIQ
jgi:hypothetical protein